MAALIAIPVSSLVLAQAPPGDEIVLLYYGVRHPDTGELLAGLFRVQDDGKDRSDGREYSWEYGKGNQFPELDPESGYLLLMLVEHPAGTDPQDFHGIIPIRQPGGIWNKCVSSAHLGQLMGN